MEAIGMVAAIVVPVVTAWGGSWIGVQRERNRNRQSLEQAAGERYLMALRDIRRLFRVSDHEDQSPTTWAQAFVKLSDVRDDCHHRLPEGWSDLRRSIRAAVGTYAGRISFADLDSRADRVPVAAHDERWRQYGLDYTDMVIALIQRWIDAPWASRRLPRLHDFDEWLEVTGRRLPSESLV